MKKGYLIPDNAQPTKNRCLRVFVPDDPLYIAVFLGSLTYFGQWTAWERDKEKRGQFAARAWRDANELTIDGLSIPCGDYPLTDDEMSVILDKLDEISERLKELEDMDVIVTQTVNGCGCGCDGETTTNTVTNPIIDPTDTGISPPYDDTVYTVVDAVKCRVANWLADITIQVMRGLSNISMTGIAIVTVVTLLISIFAVFNGVLGDEIAWGVILFMVAQAYIDLSQNDDFSVYDLDILANEIESMKHEFVCVLYGWTTASELSSSLLGFLYARIDEISINTGWSPDTVQKLKGIFAKIFGSELSNYVVGHVETIVPADFVPAYDCLCGATGDSCPAAAIVLAGIGTLPAGDLTGTTQGFASSFNSSTGYYEIVFELPDNYCVTIDNGAYTPDERHETCENGVMVASDGTCVRRFVARSLEPFATAVTFLAQSDDCDCSGIVADDCLDLTNCSVVLEKAVNATGEYSGNDSSLSLSMAGGILSFEFLATGHTVASTPRYTAQFVFGNDGYALSKRVVKLYDVEVEGVGIGAYVDSVSIPATYPAFIAGSVSSTDRPCVHDAILNQLGVDIAVSDDASKTIEIGCTRPGDGNYTRITGKIEFCGHYSM